MPAIQRYQHKDCRFLDVKLDGDTGRFEGLASVYGITDLGGDIVEKGAFNKSIKDRGAEVPILWQHDSGLSIGLGEVHDTPKGLAISGQLELELPEAKSAYIRLKAGLVKGLSIGYKSIPDKTTMDKGIRRLKEVILYEVSLVTFPMNEKALVTAVKGNLTEEKADFTTTLEAAQTWAQRYMMEQALCESLSSIVWDTQMSAEDRITAADESIGQFRDQYIEFLPRLFALMDSRYKAQIEAFETKEGRTISKATRTRIEEAITSLQALLEATEAAGHGTPESKGAAEQHSTEPDQIHSWLTILEKQSKEIVL